MSLHVTYHIDIREALSDIFITININTTKTNVFYTTISQLTDHVYYQHTGGNNVLKATLYLLDELDHNALLALQSAVQDKLEVINAEETSKVTCYITQFCLLLM